ncbi:MAG: hypothetical protein L6R43_03855, partial [Planctomycetes bacterium]|nr:hypothetical protein [Planctomycetota bacterium]
MGTFDLLLLHPLASAVFLVLLVPGRSRFLLPLAALLAGILLSLPLAWWERLEGAPGLASLVAMIALGLPAFAMGVIAWALGRRQENPAPHAAWARRFFSVSFASSMLLLAVPMAAGMRAGEVDRARSWIESLGAEVRREREEEGKFPARIDDLLAGVPDPPAAVTRSGGPVYMLEGEGFRLEFS